MTPADTPKSPRKGPALVLTWALLMLTWMMLSGMFDLFHLALGAIASAIVARFSHNLLFPDGIPAGLAGTWLRFLQYIFWLLWQIFLSSVHVLKLVFHPRMHEKIDPHIMKFQSRIQNNTGRVTFGNSITLTPGTITVSITPLGKFTVHGIDRNSSDGLPGEMEERVARIFGE